MNQYRKNKLKQAKRGQIETFGLAFIVILISIGFFIFISFKSQQKQENPQKEFTNDKLASDFILSIGRVNIEGCNEYNLENLIQDCVMENRISCGMRGSCEVANETVNLLLNKTFAPMNTKLRLYSENLQDPNGHEIFNISYRNCTSKSRQGRAGSWAISMYPISNRVGFVYLNVCYQ